MASTLYISLPSRVVAQNRPDWAAQSLAFALISDEGRLQQQGQSSLAELRSMASAAKQVAFLLAASDASLLTAAVPPMSPAKLKQALPNLLEDQLINDPADLILVAGAAKDGEVSVVVADRAWLESVARNVKDWPARKFSAYPSQLGLAFNVAAKPESEAATAFIEEKDDTLELSLRDGLQHGLGLSVETTAPADVLSMLVQLSKTPDLLAYVPPASQDAYQQAAKTAGLEDRITIMPASWINKVAGIAADTPDLMTGVAAEHMASFDWSKWRWPVRLALAVLVVNVLALNVEWLGMKREADEINKSLNQVFRNAYPKETVVQDALKQMQLNVNAAKRVAGQFAANDFAVMASQFTQAWDRTGVPGGIASVEYKDRALFVKVKPNTQISTDVLRSALAEQSLELKTTPEGLLRISIGGKK
ncbi:type II secretion system protein GspL [Undibacterium sp. TS12]|uniref:type II secretion system protein GspL n=1 Tax=Undibacterium sp. TS12 TaxID=2908202 RepID=UPI001F4CFD98|nr:type II secretion system protein GspL [Undibacterium sp. TS12]MCH8618851.1 type II secretion system protein GspL [Undibacterium sp. TS12]